MAKSPGKISIYVSRVELDQEKEKRQERYSTIENGWVELGSRAFVVCGKVV
jgi:hypothetical protein